MAVEVTKTTVTVQWAWQRKTEPIRVERYRVVLRFNSDDQALLLWPNQSEHTFKNLIPNREYSLLLLADNSYITQEAIFTRTYFDALTATLVPSVILLSVTMFLCFLSRKVYNYYFVSMVSSPKRSATGLWLMDKHQQASVRNILNIEDFRVTDKHPIKVAAGAQHHLEATQYTNTRPGANGGVLLLSPNYISNSPVAMEALSEVQPLFLPPHHHRSRFFPQEEEVTSQFHTPEVFNLCFGLLDLPGGPPMFCESDYVLSSNFTETSPAESSFI
ncbi:hypothetical protein CRUP_001654 [Coryphaenoides rupestris]|nr:hypothetical protein CRUP_001654 [Coryphaenoides rupestris]